MKTQKQFYYFVLFEAFIFSYFLSVCSFQVEWIEQQVVKRRIKRDYKPAPPLSQTSPTFSNQAQNNIFFNDAKWSSMWYIVSTLYSLACFPQRTSCCPHLNSLWIKDQGQGLGMGLLTMAPVELNDLFVFS